MKFNDSLQQWEINIPVDFNQDTSLMMVLQTAQNNFYAETKMAFSEYKTTFNKTF